MDILSLLNDNGVSYQTEGHKHTQEGWVNMPCPFCIGNPGLHLGITLDGSHAYCWRCGWKPMNLAISGLLNISEQKAYFLIKEYGGISVYDKKITQKQEFVYPSNSVPLLENHKKYLEKRGFDAEHICSQWHILSTSPSSILTDNGKPIEYKNRILIPIYWDNKVVSFQTRTTADISMRYITCPKSREIIHHKDILYGNQHGWKDTGIVVEGITDVWRMGVTTAATFGIEFTPRQVRVLAKNFKRVIVIFDGEEQAQKQADKLINELRARGISSAKEVIQGDPAELSQSEANYITNNIIYGKNKVSCIV